MTYANLHPGDRVFWRRCEDRPRILCSVVTPVYPDQVKLNPIIRQWTKGREVVVPISEVDPYTKEQPK